ncbi:hypothetical protein F0562_017037 [Nyssa sinensis]|uniref:CASP-like protein n=1 Tax=Nyssa sinensis TaxID=561372 RepID=A0A5J4ZDS7_9ASTE|nr:hypothetical protein F0562_017037 [Nyssa sinensis]
MKNSESTTIDISETKKETKGKAPLLAAPMATSSAVVEAKGGYKKGIAIFDFILRLCAIAATLAATVAMGTRGSANRGRWATSNGLLACLPFITLYSNDAFRQRGCIETLSSISRDYNRMLQNQLKAMQSSNLTIVYADIYIPLSDMIQRHSQFGKWVHPDNSCTRI